MEKISFGNSLPGYEIGDKSKPAIVVIQEWWGINEVIKEHAIRLNKDTGFRCLIPDLYKGKLGVNAEEASHLMNNLDFQNAVEELKQAVAYLRSTGAPKVGVVGFCMGGALCFCAAQHAGVDAAAPFYGTPNPAICKVEEIKVPVEAHFGADDTVKGFSDTEAAHAHEAKMKAAGCDATFYIYQGCNHGFMNMLCGPDAVEMLKALNYHENNIDEVNKAYTRLVAFMHKHLA